MAKVEPATLDALQLSRTVSVVLPLAGTSIPADPNALARALGEGLHARGLTAREVQATGSAWPRLDRLTIDLTGAQASRALRLPMVHKPAGKGITIGEFKLHAAPLLVQQVPVDVRSWLSEAAARFSLDDTGALFLTLERAAAGELEVSVAHAALERGLHALAQELAAKQGADVKSTKLELETPTPRALVFRVAVTAKVMIMKATVHLRGRADLDDQLNARLSQLSAQGEGMFSALIESGLRPHLARLENQTFALGGLVAGGLRVNELAISAGETVRLHATLASSAT